MSYKIPFSILPTKILEKSSGSFSFASRKLKKIFPNLEQNLKVAQIDLDRETYLNMCLFATVIFYVFISFFLLVILYYFQVQNSISRSFLIAIPIALFVLTQQFLYPKILSNKKIKNIDKNLLPALQSILVNINSGVPLFDTIASIASENYGQISEEFKKAVKRIHSGEPEIDVLNQIANENPSLYFRRAIWQIVNGMKSGSNVSGVIYDVIEALSYEQTVQIESYGSKLKSLVMFYMMIAVIVPSLGMTFLTVISSFAGIGESIAKMIFWGLFAMVIFVNIMFIGIINSVRPSLIGGQNA